MSPSSDETDPLQAFFQPSGSPLAEDVRRRLALHATWILSDGREGERAVLDGAGLKGADLAGLDLRRASLRGCDLSGANLIGSLLDGAELTGANLDGGKLQGASLRGARLEGAGLAAASLNEADLTEARMDRARMGGAILSHAVMSKASLIDADLTVIEGLALDASEARLDVADLRGARLEDADFSGARMIGAKLAKALLRHAVFDGADLRSADLSGVFGEALSARGARMSRASLEGARLDAPDFVGADLAQVRLEGASLRFASFKGASLRRAEGLRSCDVAGADFSETNGLLGREFSGRDVSGIVLPETQAQFHVLDHVKDVSQTGRGVFLSLIVICIYALLTVAGMTDADLLVARRVSALPIIGAAVPLAWFCWIGPVLIAAVYLYLHLYLQRLWRAVSRLPARFPDGAPVDQRVYPWLLTGLARLQFKALRSDRTPNFVIEAAAAIAVAWAMAPLVVAVIWLRALPAHDLALSLGQSAVLALMIGFGTASLRLATTEFGAADDGPDAGPDAGRDEPGAAPKRARLLARAFRASFPPARTAGAFLLFAIASGAAIVGVPDESGEAWVPLAKARLSGAEISTPSRGGAPVRGADLRGADLRHADLSRAFAAGADFGGAALAQADLRSADLSGAAFDGADLRGADLRGAKGLLRGQLDRACGDGATRVTALMTPLPSCPGGGGR